MLANKTVINSACGMSINPVEIARLRSIGLLLLVARDARRSAVRICQVVMLAMILLISSGCMASRPSFVSRYSTTAVTDLSESEKIDDTAETARIADSENYSADRESRTEESEAEELLLTSDEAEETIVIPMPGLVDEEQLSAAELTPVPIAEQEMKQGMTLSTLEQLAMSHNPAIEQAVAAAYRARGIRNQVGLKPNPSIGYNGAQLADAGTDQHLFFVEQTFVRGDKLEWNREVIGHDVNSMNWLVETQRQRLLTDVRIAFYAALGAQKRKELAEEFREEALKGVQVSKDRVKAGVAAKPDVLQSEIQLSEVDLAIRQAELEYSAAWSEIAALTGIPDLVSTELIGELSSKGKIRDSNTEYSRITGSSPLLMAARARVDRARTNLQRQQNQPVPNLNGQLGAGYDHGTDQGFLNVQVSLPLPVHNKNQGNIQAAQAEFCEAVRNVERLEMSIRKELAVVIREYQVAEATVQQYEQIILPKALEAMNLMQMARNSGEFDFLRVLTTRRAYYDANILYVVALGELAQADAKIDGLLLSDSLNVIETYDGDDSLRGEALDGQ